MLLRWSLTLVASFAAASMSFADSTDLETLWTFDDIPTGKLPANFAPGSQSGNSGPRWRVIETDKALSPPKVLVTGKRSQNTGHPDVIFVNQLIEGNFELSVSLLTATNKSGTGNGLMWRAQDNRDYYLLQVSPLGQNNIVLYRVVKGVRTLLDAVTRPFGQSEWHTLQVIVLDDRFVATLNGRAVLDGRDQRFTKGRFGLWSSGIGITYFDNLHLKKLK